MEILSLKDFNIKKEDVNPDPLNRPFVMLTDARNGRKIRMFIHWVLQQNMTQKPNHTLIESARGKFKVVESIVEIETKILEELRNENKI